MKLTRVTITGADDAVDPDDLNKLSEQYPFVEWGILASASRMGSPRYPTPAWIEYRAAAVPGMRSLHLCGALSRRALAGLHLPSEWPGFQWPRVQLNGFGAYRLPLLGIAYLNPRTEFILQVQDNAALLHASDLYKQHTNLSALWDLSGGEGKPITYLVNRMHEYRIERDNCEARHSDPAAAVQRQREEDAAQWEARLKSADYVLWEVHEIDPRAPTSTLGELCSKVSVHSVDWLNTTLMGYSVFSDARGRKQLTCRWLKAKAVP